MAPDVIERTAPVRKQPLMTALDGLGARPAAEVLQERLRTLAAGLAGADLLVRELVRAEAVARLNALGVRTPARIVDAALGDARRAWPRKRYRREPAPRGRAGFDHA